MHERLYRAVVPDAAEGTLDPKTELALAGWVSLHTDGLTRRVYIDAPDDFAEAAVVKRFARSHDAESIVMARHPSGDVTRWQSPGAVSVTEQ
ncbi:unknown [Haloarcula marismortui ATCC 43049]|nr:unknown [Haloarcula marismortui ATCC 43049]